MIPKPDTDFSRNENYRPTSLRNTDKNFSQNITKPNLAIYKK